MGAHPRGSPPTYVYLYCPQVEEVLALQRELDRTRKGTVEKAAARSWVVNYVEASRSRYETSHAEELLGARCDGLHLQLPRGVPKKVALVGSNHPFWAPLGTRKYDRVSIFQ